MTLSTPKRTRPSYTVLDLKAALAQDWRGWHLSRKADGICVQREWSGCRVWGDSMPDGRLMVWEIDRAFGQDVRQLPWQNGREAALTQLFTDLNPKLNWQRCPSGHGAEFIEAMIAAARIENTPDVIVAKPLDAPFGVNLVKSKILDPHDCIVTEMSDKLSIRVGQVASRHAPSGAIESSATLVDRGWCPCFRLDVLENLKIGDVVEIFAAGIHTGGKFREPRMGRTRFDKPAAECVI